MIDYLKEKYSNPIKAYKSYFLGKNFYRVSAINKEISEEKEIRYYDLQNVINDICTLIIENTLKTETVDNLLKNLLAKYYPNKEYSKINFIHSFYDDLFCLGYERSDIIDFFSLNLVTEFPSNISWENLEEILKEEKLIVNPNEIDTKQNLEKISKKYNLGFVSVSLNNATEKKINEIDNNFDLICKILNISANEIKNKKLNYIDTNFTALYDGRYYSDVLLVKSNQSKRAFAHEFFHYLDIDNEDLAISTTSSSMIELVKKLKKQNPPLNIEDKKQIFINAINELLDLYKNKYYDDTTALKKYIDKQTKILFSGKFNSENILENILKFTPKSPYTANIIMSEFTLFNNYLKKQQKHSDFYEFALISDNLDKEEYASLNLEMAARIFETYCAHYCKNNKVDNNISNPRLNNFSISDFEFKRIFVEFKSLLDEIVTKLKDSKTLLDNIDKHRVVELNKEKEAVFSNN